MGFCRRCGDIVSGVRCKCGGLAVRASVDFSQTASQAAQPDLWSRTYVRSTTQNPSPLRERSTTLPASTPRPFSEAPNLTRPRSTYLSRSTLGDPIMSHIESALARDSHDSVTAGISKKDDVFDTSSHDDILLDPNTSTLAKAYGSVLQPKESLSFFTCIVCSSPFPPDATIYPDPNEPATTTRFLCKPCFIKNGGAKGDCASCGRPILILTSEGGFIENAGRLWHKRCFRCDGCFKDTSDRPMVDLLGRPSCEDCFDTCLKRPRSDSIGSKRASISTPDKEDIRSNPGGMKRGTSRDGSPAIEELQQRLGIKSRESSPLIERKTVKITDRETSPIVPDLTQRMSDLSVKAIQVPDSRDSRVEDSPSKTSNASPRGRYAKFRLSSMSASSKPITIHSPSPRAENNTVDDMERRLLRRSLTGSPSTTSHSPTRPSRDSLGGVSFTPDLTDSSSSVSTFSPPLTPSNSPPVQLGTTPDRTPTKPQLNQFDESPTKLILSSPSTPCAKCSKPLFRTRGGGKFVTVPEESSKRLPPKSYHVECFRCAVCEGPFEETKSGQAIFIRTSTGCCHVNCATPERIVIRPIKAKSTSVSSTSPPTKHDQPPATAPPAMNSFPRLGSAVTCPGCRISVSPMERGVVPGPQGSRWHASCLVCGGRGAQSGPRRAPNTPGCGKRLDSAAKTDGDGGVWCRECLLLIDSTIRQDSPTKPLEPSFTGTTGMFRFPAMGGRRNEGIVPQLTGTTTIARQFTGMGALTSQLTGSGLNPTRQLPKDLNRSPSPTKGMLLNRYNEGRRVPFPRPKSVSVIRGKSVDEGRGMFLVRQLTGSGGGAGLDP